jgi:twitching motility protein PilT
MPIAMFVPDKGGGFGAGAEEGIEQIGSAMPGEIPQGDSILQLVRQAVEMNASDVHLRAGTPPRLRIDGDLGQVKGFVPTADQMWRFFKRVMSTIQVQLYERYLELDFSTTLENLCRIRVNLYQERGKFCAAIRLVPRHIPTTEEIGLPENCVRLADLPRGLVLVVGPTGSGKSTTLATLLNYINATRLGHILSIEDPIEYYYTEKRAYVTQREVDRDTRSFAAALRHSFRQDPDVVLLGEMRDLETIQLAMTLAETGHLTFSTLHTANCTQTITRIIDVFPPHQQDQIRNQLALSLEAVMAQRLLRRKGNSGRVAVREIMICTRAIRNLIREGKYNQIYSAIQTGVDEGMVTMEAALGVLLKAGLVDYETAYEASGNSREFAEKHRGLMG